MYPRKFDYHRPLSLAEAIDVMGQYGFDARPLAGGQSLIPLMKLRLANPEVVVDLNGIPGLGYVQQEDTSLAIGAVTRYVDVESSGLARAEFPMVADVVRDIGDAQVRNRGTVGGALAHADPSGDWGPVFLAAGGEVRCVGPKGQRLIGAAEFFTDTYETARQVDEIVTEVRMRRPGTGSGSAYLKLERRSGDFAVVGVAVQVVLAEGGVCKDIGIGLSGVGPTAVKGVTAETVLRGNRLTESTILEAAQQIASDIDPYTDVRGTAEYKADMARVHFIRALELARQRAA